RSCNFEAYIMTAKLSLEEKFRATGGKGPYVQRLFGRIARVYDPMNRLMSFGLDRRWRVFAARYLALSTGELGLDLGAGTADLSIEVIRNSGPGTRMIGIDITPEMLEVGRIKIARLGLQDRIDLRVGDAEHIDLPDNSVDGCCSAFTVRNLTDIRQGFREMLRVVRPGNRVVCLEITHPPYSRPYKDTSQPYSGCYEHPCQPARPPRRCRRHQVSVSQRPRIASYCA